MASSKITLYSFAKYLNDNDDDLFANISLPDGIDKDTLTDNILMRGGEFEVLYSNPYFMQTVIGTWSSKWYRTFEKWIEALNIEYDPLYNYDRNESYTDVTDKDTSNTRTHANTDTQTLANTDTRTNANTDTQTLTNNNTRTLNNTDTRTLDTTNNAETTVSAYDSSNYESANNIETTDDGTITDAHTGTVSDVGGGSVTDAHTGTITDAHSGTVTDAHTGTIGDVYKDDTTFTHTSRIYGNVGVTTSQQMLEAELDLAKWNIYEHITDIFLEEFIIPIYS